LYGSQEDILCADAELEENNIATLINISAAVLQRFLQKKFCAEILKARKEELLCNMI